jgi:hypothetical protein
MASRSENCSVDTVRLIAIAAITIALAAVIFAFSNGGLDNLSYQSDGKPHRFDCVVRVLRWCWFTSLVAVMIYMIWHEFSKM